MGDLLIRNVPEALKSDLEEHAARSGHTLDMAVVEPLRAGLSAISEDIPMRDPSLLPGQRLLGLARESGLENETDDDDTAFRNTLDAIRQSGPRQRQPE